MRDSDGEKTPDYDGCAQGSLPGGRGMEYEWELMKRRKTSICKIT